jgi:hypothetical protein
MPSYIDFDTPIFGISMVPTWVSASAARGSAGGLSGSGKVAGTAVVVGAIVVDVLVELVVVDEVEVGGGLVVVTTVVVAGAVMAAAGVASAPRSELSSPHAANVRTNTQLAAIQARRMVHSASQSATQQCTHGLAAGLHARRNADAVVAGAGKGDARGQPPFGGGDRGAVVRPVLRERIRPAADTDGGRLKIDGQVPVQLVDDVGQELVIGQMERRQPVPAE